MKHLLALALLATGGIVSGVVPAAAQIEIPLTYDPASLRVGIQASFETSTPGVFTAPQHFLLDTGSPGFLVNEGVDIGASTSTNTQDLAEFGLSNNTFNPFNEYTGTIGFLDKNAARHTVTANFGQAFSGMYDGTNYPDGGTVENDPVTPGGDLANGILGASLHPSGYTGNVTLFSLLGQINVGPGLTPGFTIDLVSSSPMLTIGVTDAQIANFTHTVTLNANAAGDVFPTTGLPTYNQKQISVDFNIGGTDFKATTNPGGNPTAIPVTLDTGAPDSAIQTGDNVDFHLTIPDTLPNENSDGDKIESGTAVIVTNEDGDTLYSFVTADSGAEEFKIESSSNDAHFNSGIEPFLQNKVTFVLGNTAGSGYVGFTVIPEPTTGSLLLGSVAGYFLARRRGRFSTK